MKDLVVLAADKNIEYALKGLFARPEALGIQPIEVDIFIEPEHDPACALRGVGFLANFAGEYKHGLLISDHEGSGKEDVQTQNLQESLNIEFEGTSWGEGRAKAIVLSPELETWVWSKSPNVDEIIGWKNRQPGLRHWLVQRGWLKSGEIKPVRPKEAFVAALREARLPRSSSIYRQLATKVSLERCTDETFWEFRNIIRNWFQSTLGKNQ